MDRSDLQTLCAYYHPASLELLIRLSQHVAGSIVRVTGERAPQQTSHGSVGPEVRRLPGAPFDVLPFLAVLPPFRDFAPRDIAGLLELGTLWTLQHGDAVLRHGSPASECVILVRGALEVSVPTPAGPQRVAILGPGALIGEVSMLLDLARTADCTVRERATILELPKSALATLRDPSLHLSFRFHQLMLENLALRLKSATRALAREKRLAEVGAPRGVESAA